MEEARLTAYLFQRLQDAVFLTERNMAEQLGKPPTPWSVCCNTVCAIISHWTVTSQNTGKEKIPL